MAILFAADFAAREAVRSFMLGALGERLTLGQRTGFCNADSGGGGSGKSATPSNFTPRPDRNEMSTATPPTIFGDGGFNGAIADVGRQPEIAMAANKPEVVITQERDISAISTDSRYFRPRPTRWSYFQHCPMSADIQPTTGNSNGGL